MAWESRQLSKPKTASKFRPQRRTIKWYSSTTTTTEAVRADLPILERHRTLTHIAFNTGFWTLFWGAFEQALQNGQPIWSTQFGPPIPHHYLAGAALAYAAYLLQTLRSTHRGKPE